MNTAVTLTKHALCILLLSKKGDNFSDSLTIGINTLIYLSSNSVLIFSNELDTFCFTREHLFSLTEKFQLKIYNSVLSILKIPANNDLLSTYCHSNLQAKEDGHLEKSNTENCYYLKDFQATVFICGIWTARPSHLLKAHLYFLKEHEKCPNLHCLHVAMSLPVYELLG